MPHHTTHESYNEELRRIRLATGKSPVEFGELLGVRGDTVSRYERGERHVPEPTIRYARALLKQHAGKQTTRGTS